MPPDEALSGESDVEWTDEAIDGDTCDGAGEEAQPPVAPPMPAPLATATTLTWDDFPVVPVAPVAGAAARTAYRRLYNGTVSYDVPTVFFLDGQFYALQTATAPVVTYTAQFNPAQSWVVAGQEGNALLAHERVHLRIAEYVAEKITAKYSSLSVTGGGIAGTRTEALALARVNATQKMQTTVADVLAKWAAIDNAVQNRYDAQTVHGTIPERQTEWATFYQDEVDSEFQKQQ